MCVQSSIQGIESKSAWNIDYNYLQPKLKFKIFFCFYGWPKTWYIWLRIEIANLISMCIQSLIEGIIIKKQKSTFMCDVRLYTSNQKSFMHN